MRVSVDRERCSGHARCVAIAPEVYDIDDDGYCVTDLTVPAGLEDTARRGAAACPERAIVVDEGAAPTPHAKMED